LACLMTTLIVRCRFFFFLMIQRPHTSTLFPYTTLFRSVEGGRRRRIAGDDHHLDVELLEEPDDVQGKMTHLRLIAGPVGEMPKIDRKSTRLNSSHQIISYAVFCLKKKKTKNK